MMKDINKNKKNNKNVNGSERGFCVKNVCAAGLLLIMAMSLTGCTSKAVRAQETAQEYITAGNYTEAIEELEKVIENADLEEPEELSMMIEAHYLKGDCYTALGDDEAAQQAYREGVDADESYPNAVKTATDYLRLGMTYVSLENYSDAIIAFSNGLTMDEVECEQQLLRNLVVCYEKTGDFDSAKARIAVYVEKYPEDTEMVEEYQFLSTR